MIIRPKVLLAEPDRKLNNSMSAMLTEHGYEVLSVTTGEEAVRMAQSHCPELILLEPELPDGNGIHVLKSVRVWSLRPLIIISSCSDAGCIAEDEAFMVRIFSPHARQSCA